MIQGAINQALGFGASLKTIAGAKQPSNDALANLTKQVDELKAQMANTQAQKVRTQARNVKQKSFRGKAKLNSKDLKLVGGK